MHFWPGVRLYGSVLDTRSRNRDVLNGIERASPRFYATVRSPYRQHRIREIRNGMPEPPGPLVTE